MKMSKILTAGALFLAATAANSSTILTPTDGDVNFTIVDADFKLAIFDDTATISDAAITAGNGLFVNLTATTFFGTTYYDGLVDFTGNPQWAAANSATPLETMSFVGGNDNFKVGLYEISTMTWYADLGDTSNALANKSYLEFDVGNGTMVVDVQVVPEVPVPAAAWLFGSGLIGLVGISRRRS